MKAKTLVSCIGQECDTFDFPSTVLTAITTKVGFTSLPLKEAKDYFYGYRGLTMYDVVITSIEKDNQDFYSKL